MDLLLYIENEFSELGRGETSLGCSTLERGKGLFLYIEKEKFLRSGALEHRMILLLYKKKLRFSALKRRETSFGSRAPKRGMILLGLVVFSWPYTLSYESLYHI